MPVSLLSKNSPLRIFAFSGILTITALLVVLALLGPGAAAIALALIIIEITLSFDNAVINARILRLLSLFWQRIFLTIGIAIAVFGMRIIFPVAIVAATSTLGWKEVIHLSLYQPNEYAAALEAAAPSITAFGGAFLLMLSLHFFMNPKKKVHWLKTSEKFLSRTPSRWLYLVVAAAALSLTALAPGNADPAQTLQAGSIGILTYLVIHGLSDYFLPSLTNSGRRVARGGMAGFIGFMYLEILDASFSLDGVIGAFALTNHVLLIAAGLGVGAVWVRSMTVYVSRRNVLNIYRYLEHGAHYAITVLAISLLVYPIGHMPEAVTGLLGVGVIGLSVFYSIKKSSRRAVRSHF